MIHKLRKLLLILLIPVLFTGSTQPISLRGVASTSYRFLRGIGRGIKTGSVMGFKCLNTIARASICCVKPIASFSTNHILGVSTGFIGLGVSYLLYKKLLTDPLDQNIKIGNSICKVTLSDDELSVNSNSSISQVKVIGQRGDSCGYHALKNAKEILNFLQHNNRNLHDRLNNAYIVERDFGPEGTWRQWVINLRLKNIIKEYIRERLRPVRDYLETLDGHLRAPWENSLNDYSEKLSNNLLSGNPVDVDILGCLRICDSENYEHYFNDVQFAPFKIETSEIDDIIENRPDLTVDLHGDNVRCEQLEGLIKVDPQFENLRNSITVIPTVEDLNTDLEDPAVGQVRAALRNNNTTLNHGFIIGTMQNNSTAGGHWITLIVNKQDNKRNYIVADSMNSSSRLYSTPVKSMIERLESPSVARSLHAPESELQDYERSLNDAVDNLNMARVRVLELYEQYKALGGSRSFTPELDETAL